MGHPKPFEGAVGGEENGAYNGGYVNIGVWGPYPSDESEFVRANREIESRMRQLGGLKWLYSRVFYTEDEWWQIYDKKRYEDLRAKFNAGSLPTIWDKVKDRGRKPEVDRGLKGFLKGLIKKSIFLSGLYGVCKAVRGGDYMLSKKKTT